MRIIIAIAVVALTSGCAMSSAGLAKSKLDETYTSAKPPKDIAVCMAENFHGMVQMTEMTPTHYVVNRMSGYGVPVARWDIRATDTGSSIEFRHSVGIMVGKDKAENCF